jgi:hypothetical protein
MDILTIVIATAALLGFVGLAFIGGWELGNANGIDGERTLANNRVRGLLAQHAKDIVAYENARKPKSSKCRRKAARKAVRA